MKKNKQNIALDLQGLQNLLIRICTTINMPIRKKVLIKMVTDLFEYKNSKKAVEFALIELVEQGLLFQKDYYISANKGKLIPTATEEGIIKFLTSHFTKANIKSTFGFNPAEELAITPHIFFKYIQDKFPELISGADMSLAYMQKIENTLPYGLNNSFYAELNDYPTDRWLSTFFDEDCRLIIHRITCQKNRICFHLLLLPGRRRSYKKAHEQYEAFEENISTYLENHMEVQVLSRPLSMVAGN